LRKRKTKKNIIISEKTKNRTIFFLLYFKEIIFIIFSFIILNFFRFSEPIAGNGLVYG
jgi:hypothetical protein